MPHADTLLFLHGIGDGDPDDKWLSVLERSLTRLGYPGVTGVNVIAPKYPNGLKGVDETKPLPKTSVRTLHGDAADTNRRNYERRRTAMEVLLGSDDPGEGVPLGDAVISLAAYFGPFSAAENYVKKPEVRSWVLHWILGKLPSSGRLLIVGHSLGSVIAADLVRRLPVELEVAGLVTIGSPLAHKNFDFADLRDGLRNPPPNLGWWVNFWTKGDPVPGHRGISPVLPWVLDHRIKTSTGPNPVTAHLAQTYMANDRVARAIGFGVFGSQSKALVLANKGVDIRLDYAETSALLALRLARLTLNQLEGDTRDRYEQAVRTVQADTVARIAQRNTHENRPLPSAISRLVVDLGDPSSPTPEPLAPGHLSMTEAVVPLTAIAAMNVLSPFEIEVPNETSQRAFSQLTLEMGLGDKLGADVLDALDEARKILKGPINWVKWIALGIGAAALIAGTAGLALVAAPGAAGAAAITSALAAFGPGGMIGGLLTAGTLVSVGGGSIAIGLAAPATAAATVEAVVATQLATAILREKHRLNQDPQTWLSLTELDVEVARQLARVECVSDKRSPGLKDLQRKRDAVRWALDFLEEAGLGPVALSGGNDS